MAKDAPSLSSVGTARNSWTEISTIQSLRKSVGCLLQLRVAKQARRQSLGDGNVRRVEDCRCVEDGESKKCTACTCTGIDSRLPAFHLSTRIETIGQ